MHMPLYPICKEFPTLPPKPLYHSLLHIITDMDV